MLHSSLTSLKNKTARISKNGFVTMLPYGSIGEANIRPLKKIYDELKIASMVCVANPHSQITLFLPLVSTSMLKDRGVFSVPRVLRIFAISQIP
jgi:hypothetical protein